jgi:hypothetical protein
MQTQAKFFPTTDWGLLNDVQRGNTGRRDVALGLIVRD